MPRQVIEHEPWCTDHSDEMDEPLCASGFIQFGPPSTEEGHKPDDRAGYLYLMQYGTESAEVNLFYPTASGTFDSTLSIGGIRQLLAALDHDAADTIAALRRALTLHDQESA
jgi:hypothetical protein